MPRNATSALVILLPEAEVLLDVARRVGPALVRPGLPAHVTALYPFLPVTDVTADVEEAVRELASATESLDVRLTEFVTTPGFAAVTTPELQPVADAVCARWPDVLPYGGRFGPRPGAHLTVAMGGTDAELGRVADEVRPLLPLNSRADALQLVTLTEQGWELRLSAPFRRPAAGTTAR